MLGGLGGMGGGGQQGGGGGMGGNLSALMANSRMAKAAMASGGYPQHRGIAPPGEGALSRLAVAESAQGGLAPPTVTAQRG